MASPLTRPRVPGPQLVALALLLLLQLSLTRVAAHSWLSDPPTYNQVYLTKHCRKQCNMVCPHKEFGRQANSVRRPAKTYRRGQRAKIQWVLNNHRGGFARLALVPVASMWSRTAHKKLAFHYTCWDSGQTRCPSRAMCGSDTTRTSMRAYVTIPRCLPDGDYVLGYVWYGGLHWSLRRGTFADYYHCSHVRVRGGDRLARSCIAEYVPGKGPSVNSRGLCRTASDEPVGKCKRDRVCRGRSFFAKPRPFSQGRAPSFSAADVRKYMGRAGRDVDVADAADDAAPATDAAETDSAEEVEPDESGREEGSEPASGSSRPRGKCRGRICCSTGCRNCARRGSRRCRRDRRRRRDKCCASEVKRTRRVCGRDAPPCVKRRRND